MPGAASGVSAKYAPPAPDEGHVLPGQASAGGQRPELLAQPAAFGLADEVQCVAADQAISAWVVQQGRIAFRLEDTACRICRDQQVGGRESKLAKAISI